MASSPYFSLAVLFLAALGFGLTPLGLAWLWGKVFYPPKPNAIKNATRPTTFPARNGRVNVLAITELSWTLP